MYDLNPVSPRKDAQHERLQFLRKSRIICHPGCCFIAVKQQRLRPLPGSHLCQKIKDGLTLALDTVMDGYVVAGEE